MEDSKTTSELLYEDDFSYLTREGDLYLKEGSHVEKRKLCSVAKEEGEQKIEELKNAFNALQKEVRELNEEETSTPEAIDSLREKLNEASAIGDFDELYEILDKIEGGGADTSPESQASEGKKKEEEGEDEGAGDEAVETEAEAKDTTETEAASKKESAGQEARAETVEAPAEEAAEETAGIEEEAKAGAEDEASDESAEEPLEYYRDIVERAKELAKQKDWPYVSMELDNLSHNWNEGPDLDSDEVSKLYREFTDTVDTFEERKKEHYEKLNKQKEENLEKKKELLSRLKSIVEDEEWTATGKVGSIKGKWNSIGQLPSNKGEDLDEEFEKQLEIFNEHKVDRLVQQRQKEEDNLILKLTVLDKMENVAGAIDESTDNWQGVDEKFDDLTKQWKKIGRVPKDKSNEVWQRYKSAQDLYYDKKYEFDKEHRKEVDKFKAKKENLCEEAEALLETKDLASAARDINKLHRRWKKVGNLPQRLEDDLWGRFKSATDAFNERKSENADKLHEQEEQHYQEKLKLIEKAEEIKDTTEWDKGHQQMQSLMDKWKEIGPVPRKKSNKIWKKFKGAMDVFYDRRREHFKEVKEDRKDNLEEKKEILDKLKELGQHEDPIEAVNIAKKLQAEFKDAGYVPIKKKNKIWKEYRKACDVIYDRFRAAKSGDKFDQELAKADLDPDDRSKIQDMRKEYKKIKKEVRQLEEEVLKYKETKTYFKPTDKGNALIDEIQQKIDKAEEKLQAKQDELETITRNMEDIKAEA